MKMTIIAAAMASLMASQGVVYRWTDDTGVTRASTSLAAIPEKHRQSAVEMKVVNVDDNSVEAMSTPKGYGAAEISFRPGAERTEAMAVFNGRAERMAIVDTGAGIMAITRKLARALGYKPENLPRSWIITSAGKLKVPMVTLDSVRIGGAEARKVRAAVIDFEGRGPVSAVIGMSFLSAFVMEVDSMAGAMTLSSKGR